MFNINFITHLGRIRVGGLVDLSGAQFKSHLLDLMAQWKLMEGFNVKIYFYA